jgi:uncharacterized membrane protein (DUF485 family)
MFISNKNRQDIDYQNSYHSRQQRKKQRYKWIKALLLLFVIIVLVLTFSPFAKSNQLQFEKQLIMTMH